MSRPRDLEELDDVANGLDDRQATWEDFASEFSRKELHLLASLCVIDPTDPDSGRAYDDEVFDAIALGVKP